MNETAGRIFASHYQLCICDDPKRSLSDEDNWNASKSAVGFAGNPSCRLVGTEADSNDHWVELRVSAHAPRLEDWQRVTCVDFVSTTGRIHAMSVVDDKPTLSLSIPSGEYALYVAANNLGVDLRTLGEKSELGDAELRERYDLERYRIFVVAGAPPTTGRLRDA